MTEAREIAIVRPRGQITIPTSLRKAAGIQEGDPIEMIKTDDGILLRPKKLIDADQAWFWTAEWQAGERQADDDVADGRVTRYTSTKEFLASLVAESPAPYAPKGATSPKKKSSRSRKVKH